MVKVIDFRNGTPVEPSEIKDSDEDEDTPTFVLELTDKKVPLEELEIELRKAREEARDEVDEE